MLKPEKRKARITKEEQNLKGTEKNRSKELKKQKQTNKNKNKKKKKKKRRKQIKKQGMSKGGCKRNISEKYGHKIDINFRF